MKAIQKPEWHHELFLRSEKDQDPS